MPENKGARGRFVKPGRGISWALRGSQARGSWALILTPGAGVGENDADAEAVAALNLSAIVAQIMAAARAA